MFRAALALLFGLYALPAVVTAEPMRWAEVLAWPAPPPGERWVYGAAPQQFGEFFAPQGPGPHPVAVVLHGGCWRNAFDLGYQRPLAAALAAEGWAVWLPEYRRLGDPGGGWPGTFEDVATAIDHLRSRAEAARLDLGRVVAIGHSAGGQLALWAATRGRGEGPGDTASPLGLTAVVGLAPITDLADYRRGPAESCHGAVEPLLGGGPEAQPARYAAVSPAQRLPIGVPMLLLQGTVDPIVPAESVWRFAEAAQAAGDRVERVSKPWGHFEPALPLSEVLAVLLPWLAERGLRP